MTLSFSTVLIANRGEIAVRIIRAARDAGLTSVAVYADPDRDALHVHLADDAYALGGEAPADTYLDIGKLLEVARRSGADAVHPGYGFLAENPTFAVAVIDAGLTWIGAPPAAIEALGDKVSARRLAHKVGVPLVPGTPGPVSGPDEAVAFAEQYGLPIAIKAAHGGGGRGLRVARNLGEVASQFTSATSEATAAFGRGECFVERWLDRPRHVETQCLADAQGHVVVVSTRDCSLQRRHQKLVEEAPAPFLTPEQVSTLYESSKQLLQAAGYVGAGTCEFLIGADGTISFLEVNPRLQVEHPVSEQVTGLDLVREQFRIASGEPLGYSDPEVRGHAIEFRINAEDPARGFLPAAGTLHQWLPPTGPGVRVDEGYRAGDVVPSFYDSLLAKVIVTAASRTEALERSRRALREPMVSGPPTVASFHRAVLDDPAFTAVDGTFGVHTRWVETEFAPRSQAHDEHADSLGEPDGGVSDTQTVVVEVNGRRFEVTMPAGPKTPHPRRSRQRRTRPGTGLLRSATALTAPVQGTVVSVAVANGDEVDMGEVVAVIEAMKMEQPVTAHRPGVVAGLALEAGDAVTAGAVLCEIVDA